MRTIAVMTGDAGAGKSTIAMHLHEELGFRRVRFAEEIKAMASAMGLTYDEIEGHLKEKPCSKLTFENIMDHLVGNIDAVMTVIVPDNGRFGFDVNAPLEMLGGKTLNYAATTFVYVVLHCVAKGDATGGATPRSLMQMIGTDWGRRMIREDLWIDLWRREINALPEGVPVVIDDCRFPNEYAECQAQGDTLVFRIERDAAKGKLGENEQKHESESFRLPFDYLVENNRTPADAAYTVQRHVASFQFQKKQ